MPKAWLANSKPSDGCEMVHRWAIAVVSPWAMLGPFVFTKSAPVIGRAWLVNVARALTSHHGDPGSIPGGFSHGSSHVEIVLNGFFSGCSSFPCPGIPALLQSHLTSPTLALKTSLLRAAQISQLNSKTLLDQRRRSRTAKTGDPRENLSVNGNVRPHAKIRVTPPEIEPGLPSMQASILTTKTLGHHLLALCDCYLDPYIKKPANLPLRSTHSRILARGNRAGQYRWSAGFLGDLQFPQPFNSGAAPYTPQTPSSALETAPCCKNVIKNEATQVGIKPRGLQSSGASRNLCPMPSQLAKFQNPQSSHAPTRSPAGPQNGSRWLQIPASREFYLHAWAICNPDENCRAKPCYGRVLGPQEAMHKAETSEDLHRSKEGVTRLIQETSDNDPRTSVLGVQLNNLQDGKLGQLIKRAMKIRDLKTRPRQEKKNAGSVLPGYALSDPVRVTHLDPPLPPALHPPPPNMLGSQRLKDDEQEFSSYLFTQRNVAFGEYSGLYHLAEVRNRVKSGSTWDISEEYGRWWMLRDQDDCSEYLCCVNEREGVTSRGLLCMEHLLGTRSEGDDWPIAVLPERRNQLLTSQFVAFVTTVHYGSCGPSLAKSTFQEYISKFCEEIKRTSFTTNSETVHLLEQEVSPSTRRTHCGGDDRSSNTDNAQTSWQKKFLPCAGDKTKDLSTSRTNKSHASIETSHAGRIGIDNGIGVRVCILMGFEVDGKIAIATDGKTDSRRLNARKGLFVTSWFGQAGTGAKSTTAFVNNYTVEVISETTEDRSLDDRTTIGTRFSKY
ncbi:hypothetical protein PR048_007715 [Dryococelus australis]|uniref:Uncharacterized protein n=1 Tax=Dryococelus australis TaxID=614101 RepID=A0ABQ9HV05_9NEOP|nr:hypothetical protein PR048_007715 [Dryococelus australis]